MPSDLSRLIGVDRDVVPGAARDGVPALAGGRVHVEHVELAPGGLVAQAEDRLRPVGVHEVDREVAARDELELRVVVEDRVVGLAGAEGVPGVGGVPGHRGDPVELVGLELLGAEDVDAERPDAGDGARVARAGGGVPRVVTARRGVLAAQHVERADLEGHGLARGLALGGPPEGRVDLGRGHRGDHPTRHDRRRLGLRDLRRALPGLLLAAGRGAPGDHRRLPAERALLLRDRHQQGLLGGQAEPGVGGDVVAGAESDGHHDSRGDAHEEDGDQGEGRPEGASTTAASVFRVPPGHAGKCIGGAPRRRFNAEIGLPLPSGGAEGAPFPARHPGSSRARSPAGDRGSRGLQHVRGRLRRRRRLLRDLRVPDHLAADARGRPARAGSRWGGSTRAAPGGSSPRPRWWPWRRSSPPSSSSRWSARSRSSRTPSGSPRSRPTSASPPSAPTTSPRGSRRPRCSTTGRCRWRSSTTSSGRCCWSAGSPGRPAARPARSA